MMIKIVEAKVKKMNNKLKIKIKIVLQKKNTYNN